MKKLLTTSALVVALMAQGAFAAPEVGGGEAKAPHHAAMQEKLSKLPEAKQALVKSMWEAGKDDRKADREEMKKLHAEKEAILTAPKFDKAAFLAKSQEIEAKRAANHAEREARMADVAAQLTQEERKILAEMKPKHGKRHHKDGDQPVDGKKAL